MKIRIYAVGKLKRGPWAEIIEDYKKRCRWNIEIIEIEPSSKSEEAVQVASMIDSDDPLIILDERGELLSSPMFASYIEKIQVQGISRLNFFIGGAYGIDSSLLQKGYKKIAFGLQTWPHLFVRAMLVEQIYRAESILCGHPYHKE